MTLLMPTMNPREVVPINVVGIGRGTRLRVTIDPDRTFQGEVRDANAARAQPTRCPWPDSGRGQPARMHITNAVGGGFLEIAAMVRAAAAGDEAAWSALVDRYLNLVWSVVRSHRLADADAHDVVQVTWLRLVEHLDRLSEPDRVGAWLATTARRECLRVIRLGRREQLTDEQWLFDDIDEEQQVDTSMLRSERDKALWTAFATLSDRCQQLLRLLMADPAPSYDEVSAALDMPIGAIGPTRGRCLEKLREQADERVGYA